MPNDLNPKLWKRLNHQQKVATVCELSCFPALLHKELGDVAGIDRAYVATLINEGRKLGLTTKRDLFPDANQWTAPSRQELIWRLRNQSAATLAARFGNRTERLLAEHGLAGLADEELQRLLATTDLPEAGPPDLAAPPPATVDLPGSGIAIPVESEAEARLVEQMIASYQDLFALRPSHWSLIRPVIDARLDFERVRVKTAPADRNEDWMGKVAIIQNRLADATEKVRRTLPDRSQADAGDLFQRAIDNSLDLLDQRGYRTTIACPHCGELLATYLFLYRNTVSYAALARKILGEFQFASTNRVNEWRVMAQAILDLESTLPFLNRELRDLGVAWIAKPLALLWTAHDEHPEVITRAFIRQLAAAMLEVSEVAIDDSLPFSPLNRLVRTEAGELRVVTPEQ